MGRGLQPCCTDAHAVAGRVRLRPCLERSLAARLSQNLTGVVASRLQGHRGCQEASSLLVHTNVEDAAPAALQCSGGCCTRTGPRSAAPLATGLG